jgi:hypothetical protein
MSADNEPGFSKGSFSGGSRRIRYKDGESAVSKSTVIYEQVTKGIIISDITSNKACLEGKETGMLGSSGAVIAFSDRLSMLPPPTSPKHWREAAHGRESISNRLAGQA